MKRLLVVEDEPGISLGLEDDLKLEGYQVEVIEDGELALQRAREETFDLIILDVMLPGKDGFQVCQALRREGIGTPIIMLTAKDQEAEKVLGLELGADDYVTKPFSPMELRARIKAVLRRREGEDLKVYRFGECEVDFTRFEFRRGGERVSLTPLEFKILAALVRHRGQVLDRDRLLDLVWGTDTFITDRVIDTHIANLRKKIETDHSEPKHLVSIRGVGYRFDA